MAKGPTVKETLATIRALGLTANYRSVYREFRIDYRIGDARRTAGPFGTSYFTDCKADAVATAARMAAWVKA